MNKRILILVSEEVLLEDYYKISLDNEDNLDVLFLGRKTHEKLGFKFNGNLITTPDFSVDSIIASLSNNKEYDYIFTCDEKLVDKVIEVSNRLGIKTNNTINNASRDKNELKKLLIKNNIPVPSSIYFETMSEINVIKDNISYPRIIKPSNSYGSNGVKLIYSEEELIKEAKNIIRINKFQTLSFSDKSGGCLIEQYLSGEEFALDVIWHDSKPICHGVMSRLHCTIDNTFPDYVYYVDPNLDQELRSKLINIATQVGQSLNVVNGATHTEVRMEGSQIYVLENAVRPGGGGYLYKLLSMAHEVNFMDLYYKSMTGNNINSDNLKDFKISNSTYNYLYSYPNQGHGIVKKIQFNSELLKGDNKIVCEELFVKPGDKVLETKFGLRYTFFILGQTTADTIDSFKNTMNDVEGCCFIEFINN